MCLSWYYYWSVCGCVYDILEGLVCDSASTAVAGNRFQPFIIQGLKSLLELLCCLLLMEGGCIMQMVFVFEGLGTYFTLLFLYLLYVCTPKFKILPKEAEIIPLAFTYLYFTACVYI